MVGASNAKLQLGIGGEEDLSEDRARLASVRVVLWGSRGATLQMKAISQAGHETERERESGRKKERTREAPLTLPPSAALSSDSCCQLCYL